MLFITILIGCALILCNATKEYILDKNLILKEMKSFNRLENTVSNPILAYLAVKGLYLENLIYLCQNLAKEYESIEKSNQIEFKFKNMERNNQLVQLIFILFPNPNISLDINEKA